MAKHQRRLFATENLPQPYHDEMHRQSYHQKSKLVTKPNLRYAKNPTRSDARKNSRNPRNDGHHAKFKNHTYPHHQSPQSPFTPPDSYYIVNATEPPTLEQIAAERERIRVEFFSTYDAMTGVRIATTLGGFFGLMVFLVIYKSRGERIETMKALKDPKIAAVAAAVMQEEEDREIQEALEATGLAIYPDDYVEPMLYPYRTRTRMMSLGNVSAPPTLNQSGRFSSIGGYSSLLTPTQRRFSYAGSYRKSNSVESSRVFSAYPIDESFDYYMESDGDEADDEFDQITSSNDVDDRAQRSQLSLPHRRESRRFSNITCCSSESSYLERRCSAITLGLSPLPAISSRCPSTTNIWDYIHQPPDIQLTQATPRVSPGSSERGDHRYHYNDGSGGSSGGSATTAATAAAMVATNRRWKKAQRRRSIDQDSFDSTSTYPERNRRFYYDEIEEEELAENTVLAQQINKLGLETRCLDDTMFKYSLNNTFQTNLLSNRRAPLASISSLKMSSVDYQDSSLRSPVSDSVFEEAYADTDDDMEPFSTDSDVEVQNAEMSSNKDGSRQQRARSKITNGKLIAAARIERNADSNDATTSCTLNKSIAMQTSFTGLNADAVDLEQETICEIDEIGPQAQQNNNRISCGMQVPTPSPPPPSPLATASVAVEENAHTFLSQMGGSTSSGNGNGSNDGNCNKHSRSTGNVTAQDATIAETKLDKSSFLSEPLNLHYRTVTDEPPKLHKTNSKTNISMQKMPTNASYCSSSSRSSSSCHSTT